jgi:ribonuclease III
MSNLKSSNKIEKQASKTPSAPSSAFHAGVDMSPYQNFCLKHIYLPFQNLALLLNAFTHRSYVNEHKKSGFQNNERLEFLGDAVLELIVTRDLFIKYPGEAEGMLTAWRSALVKTESIGAVAQSLEMDKILRLSKGEKLALERSRTQVMANTYEAFLGAVYLEFGLDVATKYVQKTLLINLKKMVSDETWRDAKSVLQERVQSKTGYPPQYKTIKEEGPDHDKQFTLAVVVGGKVIATASGHSKQDAQQKAAAIALKHITQKPVSGQID